VDPPVISVRIAGQLFTVEDDGINITYSANGLTITAQREGAGNLIGRLKWMSINLIIKKFPKKKSSLHVSLGRLYHKEENRLT
jgi:hypothetical protein